MLNQFKNEYSICKLNNVLKAQIKPSGRKIRPIIPTKKVVSFVESTSMTNFLSRRFFHEAILHHRLSYQILLQHPLPFSRTIRSNQLQLGRLRTQ